MINITYLLGAGASANAFPVIKGNSKSSGLSEHLKEFIIDFEKETSASPIEDEKKLIPALKNITEKCIEFGTPDLYAKFLLETGDDENYVLLKNILSEYFKYKESNKMFDPRALSFLTTITQNNKIPENIKILSWNYDNQLELAAKKLKHINRQDRVVDGFTNWPNNVSNYNLKEDQNPFLIHLNGVAGYNYSQRTLFEERYNNFNFHKDDKELLLSFAWEDANTGLMRTFHENRIPIAKRIASKTIILVVIGYSFPFFNREIDKQLFGEMGNLNKIYFQNPILDGNQLKQQFDKLDRIEIINIKQTDNYHIPYEL